MGCDIFQQDLNSYNLLFSFCFNKRLKSSIPFYYFVLFFMVHHVDFFSSDSRKINGTIEKDI